MRRLCRTDSFIQVCHSSVDNRWWCDSLDQGNRRIKYIRRRRQSGSFSWILQEASPLHHNPSFFSTHLNNSLLWTESPVIAHKTATRWRLTHSLAFADRKSGLKTGAESLSPCHGGLSTWIGLVSDSSLSTSTEIFLVFSRPIAAISPRPANRKIRVSSVPNEFRCSVIDSPKVVYRLLYFGLSELFREVSSLRDLQQTFLKSTKHDKYLANWAKL